jgi:hypothetical protein
MSRRIEIAGGIRRDEDEACRLCGTAEREASERVRPQGPKPKPDPFDVPEPPAKPDPFSDVELPEKKLPRKPNPFRD